MTERVVVNGYAVVTAVVPLETYPPAPDTRPWIEGFPDDAYLAVTFASPDHEALRSALDANKFSHMRADSARRVAAGRLAR